LVGKERLLCGCHLLCGVLVTLEWNERKSAVPDHRRTNPATGSNEFPACEFPGKHIDPYLYALHSFKKSAVAEKRSFLQLE